MTRRGLLVAPAAAVAVRFLAYVLQVALCHEETGEDGGFPCVVIKSPPLLERIKSWFGW
jgi:hypothetical protein